MEGADRMLIGERLEEGGQVDSVSYRNEQVSATHIAGVWTQSRVITTLSTPVRESHI